MSSIFTILLLSLAFATNPAETPSAFDLDEAKKRCLSHFENSPEVYASDFSWGMTLLEMEDRFETIYLSGKRLNMHSQYLPDQGQFILYQDDTRHLPVRISENFIHSVTRQIEVALQRGFADFVFFPDMGHSHLYFPETHWQENYENLNIPHDEKNKLYELMLNDPKMKPLYHLAEQLKMQDEEKNVLTDEIIFFKYWHRNFVGYNDGSGNFQIEVAPQTKQFNTVKLIDGHHSYSAGFAVSASKDGCFPYTDKDGKVRYFDIGLQDPRYDPNVIPEGGMGY